MDTKTERKTNPVLQDLIKDCEAAARKHDAAIWGDVAAALKKATRQQREVNLSHIERHTEDGDVVVVPGKVLGAGRVTADVTVAALEFTASAREAIEETGSTLYIEELVNDKPDGSGVTLLG